MIMRLRRTFVVLTVGLVTCVLACVLGLSYHASAVAYDDALDQALERALVGSFDVRPVIGGALGQADAGPARVPVFCAEVSYGGIVLRSNGLAVDIGTQELSQVLEQAVDAQDDAGELPELHLRWRRSFADGAMRIAVADTSTMRDALASQLTGYLVVVALAALVVGVATFLLSRRVVAPIERAFEQQRRFVADASHELKTPLAVIMANTDILLAHPERFSEEDLGWMRATRHEAQRMNGLVGELLDLARTDAAAAGDAAGMEREDVDLSTLVDLAVLEFEAIAFERGCTLAARIEPDCRVTGDRGQLERLVKILVENATKYAAVGSEVLVTLAREGRACVLAVHNEGEPVPPEDLPHLFERFYRSDKARTRADGSAVGGYGLGLAIARGIAEAHGGQIGVTSTAEAGTTFEVRLP